MNAFNVFASLEGEYLGYFDGAWEADREACRRYGNDSRGHGLLCHLISCGSERDKCGKAEYYHSYECSCEWRMVFTKTTK